MKLLSKLKDLFKRKGIAKERKFLSDSESEKAVLRLLEKETFRFLYLDNLTLEILQSKKRETSKLIETYLSNSNSGISESSSTYLLKDYLKAVDEADLIKDQYFLEISSPGVERNIRKDKHFEESIGKEVDIKLFKPLENKEKEITGILKSFDKESINIELEDKSEITILRSNISTIKWTFKW